MSPIAHGGVALFAWQISASRKNWRTLALFLFVGNLPDIDFALNLLLGHNRLSLHQYFTHNLLFILVATSLLSLFLPAGRDRWGLILLGLSHLVLDIIVIDPARPIGIRPFFPFSSVLYNFGFFPYLERWRLRTMISWRNGGVLLLEAAVFLFPVLIIYGKRILKTVRGRAFWTA
jgi:membrane-bound metal-dependent hydrolase YbcI (DUF457 family)